MIRAVLDPGVLISALISPEGTPAHLVNAWRQGAFSLVVSEQLLRELEGVLLRPRFRRWAAEEDVVEFVEAIRARADIEPDPSSIEAISSDPGDDYLIALAVSAGAHVLVSGDRDLTELEQLRPPVRTPLAFLDALA